LFARYVAEWLPLPNFYLVKAISLWSLVSMEGVPYHFTSAQNLGFHEVQQHCDNLCGFASASLNGFDLGPRAQRRSWADHRDSSATWAQNGKQGGLKSATKYLTIARRDVPKRELYAQRDI